jgi:hypothetical protein
MRQGSEMEAGVSQSVAHTAEMAWKIIDINVESIDSIDLKHRLHQWILPHDQLVKGRVAGSWRTPQKGELIER